MTGTNTTAEFWDFNGVSLNTPFWNITSFGGSRQSLPLFRGQNYTIAYRNGQMWRNKYFDQRTVTLAMWTAGISQTTQQPSSNQSLDFNSNFYALRSMFAAQAAQGSQLAYLTRRWYETVNGSPTLLSGTAKVELAGNMEPTMSGRTRADFSVDFLLPDPFFYGPQVSTTVPCGSAVTVTNPGDAVAGLGQSSVNGGYDFTITFNGPLFGPTLTNERNGVSVTIDTIIPTGSYITLDVLNYTAYDNSGTSWAGKISHSGAKPWMALVGAGGPQGNGGNQTVSLSDESGNPGNAVINFYPGYL